MKLSSSSPSSASSTPLASLGKSRRDHFKLEVSIPHLKTRRESLSLLRHDVDPPKSHNLIFNFFPLLPTRCFRRSIHTHNNNNQWSLSFSMKSLFTTEREGKWWQWKRSPPTPSEPSCLLWRIWRKGIGKSARKVDLIWWKIWMEIEKESMNERLAAHERVYMVFADGSRWRWWGELSRFPLESIPIGEPLKSLRLLINRRLNYACKRANIKSCHECSLSSEA